MKAVKRRFFVKALWITGLLVVAFCCTGCSRIPHERFFAMQSKEDAIYGEAVGAFFTALDNRNAQEVRQLFSVSVQASALDLDEQIHRLMEVYPGPTEIDEEMNYLLAGSYSSNYGSKVSSVYSWFPVISNGEYYFCRLELMYENDEDEEQIGITNVQFFTDDEYCLLRYDEFGKELEADTIGLQVYADRVLTDCEVRTVEGHPYQFTPADMPLDEGEVKAFLDQSNVYADFIAHFGEPNAVYIYSIYELPAEAGKMRYLRIGVENQTGEIYGASVVDDLNWLYALWESDE